MAQRARAADPAPVAEPLQLPATARGKRTRQRLLDAAEEVFGEVGYHQAGIVEITQRARVAPGTFYLYFREKHAIFEELVRTLNSLLRAEIREAIAGLDDRVEKEVTGFETFFRFVLRHRNLYQVIRQAESVDPALLRWHYDTLARGYVRGLQAAQAAGQIRADLDPEALAYTLMGIAEALGMRWVIWEGEFPSERVRRTFREFITGGLGSSLEHRR